MGYSEAFASGLVCQGGQRFATANSVSPRQPDQQSESREGLVRRTLQAAHCELTMRRWSFLMKIGKASCFHSLSREWDIRMSQSCCAAGRSAAGPCLTRNICSTRKSRLVCYRGLPSRHSACSCWRERNSGSGNEFYRLKSYRAKQNSPAEFGKAAYRKQHRQELMKHQRTSCRKRKNSNASLLMRTIAA